MVDLIVRIYGNPMPKVFSFPDEDAARVARTMVSILVPNGIVLSADIRQQFSCGDVVLDTAVIDLVRGIAGGWKDNQKPGQIALIKYLRTVTGAGLKEAKDAVDSIARTVA